MAKKRFLDSDDEKEIFDDVSEKKAIPELILKGNILQAQDKMLISERNMMNNFRASGYKRFYANDVIIFSGDIVLLFGFIKQMILDSGLKSENDKNTYKRLLELENGVYYGTKSLISFKNFLLKYLHLLNLTNLFVSQGKNWKDEIKGEY